MPYGMAAGQFTRGYLGQEEVERRRGMEERSAEAKAEQQQFERGMAEQEMGMRQQELEGAQQERQLKMDKFKADMQKENFTEAARRMLTGDFAGAVEHFNKSGKKKIQPGSVQVIKDPEDGSTIFTWKDAETGEDVVMDSRFMMLTAGIKPKDLETAPEAHSRAMELAKAKTAAGKRPAQLQVYDHILNNLKKEDGTPYSPEEAWSKAMEGKTTATREVARMAASLTRDGMDPEEATAKASEMWDAITAAYGTGTGKRADKGAMDGPGGTPMVSVDDLLQSGKARMQAVTPDPDADIEDDL